MHQSGPLKIVDTMVVALDGFVVSEVYADREWPDDGPVVLSLDRKVFPVLA